MNGPITSMAKFRYDIVGDIAIIKNRARKDQMTMAKLIMEKHKRIKVVLAQTDAVQGIFRLCHFRLVMGEDRTTTMHHENRCVFYIDLSAVHFSPRLVQERSVISNRVKANENILNMFGGIGSFSIEIAKNNPLVKIYNIDINPEAIRLCVKNIQANHLRGKITAVLSDAKVATILLFLHRMNRVILPLPEKSHEYFDMAIRALTNKGVMHYYDFIDADKNESPIKKMTSRIKQLIEKNRIILNNGRIVKSVGPRRYLVSLELFKES